MILLALLFPFLGLLLSAAILAKCDKTGQGIAPQFKRLLPTALRTCCVYLPATLCVQLFTLYESPLPMLIVLAVCTVLPFLSACIPPKSGRSGRFLRILSVSAMVLILAEVFVCNGKCITLHRVDERPALDSLQLEGSVFAAEESLEATGIAAFRITNPPAYADTVQMELRRDSLENAFRIKLTLAMRDQSSKTADIIARRDSVIGDGVYTLTCKPYQSASVLRVTLDDVNCPIHITNIRLLSAPLFSFSVVRFLLLLFICAFCAAVRCWELYRLRISDRSLGAALLLNGMTVLCVISALPFFTHALPLVYDPNFDYSGGDAYMQTFDAFQDGHVWLNTDVDPEFAALENPYDRMARDASGTTYRWDFAYKDGRYYSYFGIAPLLLFYYPYFWFTGNIAQLSTASNFFILLSIVFICLALRSFARLLIPDGNLMLLALMHPVIIGTAGIYFSVNFTNTYNLPIVCGIACLTLSLWLGVEAIMTQEKKNRLIKLAISGLALGLCAASRPGMAVNAAILLPLFFGILRSKQINTAYKAQSAAVFVVPVLCCIGLIFWYNNARFGSPLDFGATYQLTVNDIHANRLNLKYIPATIYNYFLLLPKPTALFPYFESEFYDVMNYGQYLYTAPMLGVLAYPMLMLGVLWLPYGLKRKSAAVSAEGVTVLQHNAIVLLFFIMSFVIAWQDICLGGILQEYTCDFLPLLSIGCCVTVLAGVRSAEQDRKRYLLVVFILAATFVFCWLMNLGPINGNLGIRCPHLYETAAKLIQFWR